MAHDESFFREVSEDLRNERFKQLWDRFGVYLIGLLVLLIVGTAAYVGYDYWQGQRAARSGDRFLAALQLADASKPDEALKALDAIQADGTGDYPDLARLRAASILANQGKTGEAIDAFRKVAADDTVQLSIRDSARIRAGFLLVDHGSYGDVADQVQQLAGADNPFRSSAREALGLAAWKKGDMKNASKWFGEITGDPQAPGSISSEAQMMLDLIKAGDKPEKSS